MRHEVSHCSHRVGGLSTSCSLRLLSRCRFGLSVVVRVLDQIINITIFSLGILSREHLVSNGICLSLGGIFLLIVLVAIVASIGSTIFACGILS